MQRGKSTGFLDNGDQPLHIRSFIFGIDPKARIYLQIICPAELLIAGQSFNESFVPSGNGFPDVLYRRIDLFSNDQHQSSFQSDGLVLPVLMVGLEERHDVFNGSIDLYIVRGGR